MNSKKKIREFVLLEKSTPRKMGNKIYLSSFTSFNQHIYQGEPNKYILADIPTQTLGYIK